MRDWAGAARRSFAATVLLAVGPAVLTLLSLPTSAAGAVADAQGPERWFALDLPAEGEAPLLPLADAEFAVLLQRHGFTGVLLDRPRDDARPADPLAAPWRAAGLAVRFAHRTTERIADLPAWPAIEPRPLPAAATETAPATPPAPSAAPPSAATWLTPFLRPAVLTRHWSGAAAAGLPPADGLNPPPSPARYLSARLLLPTAPALRITQLQLDLASFGIPESLLPSAITSLRADERLMRQSALASALATLLGGDHPELVAPLEQQASDALDALRHRPLRRAPAWLELDEWLGSFGADGTLLGARLLATRDPPPSLARALADARNRAAVPSGPGPEGVASGEELDWVADALALRWRAVARLATRLRDPHFEAELPLAVARPPAALSLPSWSEGARFEAEAAVDARFALHPWRIHHLALELRSARLRPPGAPVALLATTLDDPRLAPFAAPLQQALEGGPFDLARWLPIAPGTAATLRTTIALRDPRQFRLRLAADAQRTIRLNGAPLIERFAAPRGELLTTLLLPAGTSELEFELAFAGNDGRVACALQLLPPRAGGLTLGATAAQLREPMARVGDSGALDGTSLLRLPTASGDVAGDAYFPFALDTSGPHDLWLHVLPGSGGELELAADEGPPLPVALEASGGWHWQRVAVPFQWESGAHSLRVRLLTSGIRLDAVAIVPSDTTFPQPPSGDRPLWESAWRFDPLGAGLVVDLPPLATGELFGRAFTAEQSGTYRLHAWLKGSDPLGAGQWAEVELSSPSTRVRMVLPAGTPSEEWVALGEVSLTAGERVELRVRGDGALARVALLR